MTTYDQKYRYGLETFDQRNEEHDRMMMGFNLPVQEEGLRKE